MLMRAASCEELRARTGNPPLMAGLHCQNVSFEGFVQNEGTDWVL